MDASGASISLEQEVQRDRDDGLVIGERGDAILQQAARDGGELRGFEQAIEAFDIEQRDQPGRQRDLRTAIDAPKRHAMGTAARALGRPGAADAIAGAITKLIVT